MERLGFIIFTLRTGEALSRVPAHLDFLSGAARATSRLDGGRLDRALRHRGDGFRATTVFHARRSLDVSGEQHVGFDEVEEELGLSRTYRARLGDPDATEAVVDRLRSLSIVESAAVQSLATTPFQVAAPAPFQVAGPAAPAVPAAADPMAPAAAQDAAAAGGAVDPHDLVHADEALALEPGDERVTVACVDTGVTLGHPELQRKLLAGYDTVDLGLGPVGAKMRLVGDSRGHDFSPLDDVGHGTQVAGIVGAQGWRMRKGVAGRSLILPIRVLAAATSGAGRAPVGVGAIPDIDAGMKVAVDLGARVINMSFGTPADSLAEGAPTPHAAVVEYASRRGCVLVAAAGNSGKQERFFPAALPEVIAVGSVSSSLGRSSFSTWGDHVAIAAPGERVQSAVRRGYRAASGTSFAAPFVAAAAALVLSHARARGQTLTPGRVRELLTGSAKSIGPKPNPETGHGLLDVAAAIRRLDQEGGTR